jgi:6-phosphogluconolactonase
VGDAPRVDSGSEPRVVVHDDAPSLARHVAAALLDLVERDQASGGVPSIVLTGGGIAEAIHRQVARQSVGRNVDWRRVDLWWGDERYVPADDPERNAGQAREMWLSHVDVDPDRVHEMPASDEDYVGVHDAAAAYAEEVRAHGTGAFDLVMLGVGPDGHIASLFPGSTHLDVDDAVAVAVTDSPKPPPQRVSLTFGALNRTRRVWFLVSGDGKADAVDRALGEADLHDIPATGVRGRVATVWFLDAAAASRL